MSDSNKDLIVTHSYTSNIWNPSLSKLYNYGFKQHMSGGCSGQVSCLFTTVNKVNEHLDDCLPCSPCLSTPLYLFVCFFHFFQISGRSLHFWSTGLFYKLVVCLFVVWLFVCLFVCLFT